MKKLVIVDDYHDLDMIASAIVGRAKFVELGTIATTGSGYRSYLGVIYEGKKPTSGEISDLLFRAKITKTDDGYVQK